MTPKKTFEDLEIGDVVIDPDGDERKVVDVFRNTLVLGSCWDGMENHATGIYSFIELKDRGYKIKQKESEWPQRGDTFFRFNSQGEIIEAQWSNSPKHQNFKKFGNCFKTRDEAEMARDTVALAIQEL